MTTITGKWKYLRIISSHNHALEPSLPEVPAPFTTNKSQFINMAIAYHDQDVLASIILPTSPGGFYVIVASLPGEMQGGDGTLRIKTDGDLDRIHDQT